MNDFEHVIVNKVKEIVQEIDSSADVFLFGSRSRGEAEEDSDFDLLIVSEYEVSLNLELQFQEAIYDVELEHDVLIESFLFSKELWKSGKTPSPLIESVRKEGILL